MIVRRSIALSLVFGSLTLFSCYYDKESVMYPDQTGGTCNTPAVVSYAQNVLPILQTYCYGCHSGAAPGGNIAMGTYSADNALALNGKLYGSLAWTAGHSPMPKGGNKLNVCKIELIKKWIDAGAPNN